MDISRDRILRKYPINTLKSSKMFFFEEKNHLKCSSYYFWFKACNSGGRATRACVDLLNAVSPFNNSIYTKCIVLILYIRIYILCRGMSMWLT